MLLKLRMKNFYCRIWTLNFVKSSKSNRFVPFSMYPRTPFARHFFQQNLLTTLKDIVHGASIAEFWTWNLEKLTHSNTFTHFVVNPRTHFTRDFFQQSLLTTLKWLLGVCHTENAFWRFVTNVF